MEEFAKIYRSEGEEAAKKYLAELDPDTQAAMFAKANEAVALVVEAWQKIGQAFSLVAEQMAEMLEPLRPYFEHEVKKERHRKRYQRMMERRRTLRARDGLRPGGRGGLA